MKINVFNKNFKRLLAIIYIGFFKLLFRRKIAAGQREKKPETGRKRRKPGG